MELTPLHKLFTIQYGNSFDLNVLESCDEYDTEKVNYVSRTRENNGVSAFVKLRDDTTPFEAGIITVAGSGNSVLESFIQSQPFYTGYHVFLLSPRGTMTDIEKLFYCYCIRRNQYKYSFGRQANRTLKDILVPKQVPKEFYNINLQSLNTINSNSINTKKLELKPTNWRYFRLDTLFEVHKGKRLTKADMEKGDTFFIGSSDSNNGITDRIGQDAIFKENSITVNYDGSVAEAYYQPIKYWALDSVNVLYPKFNLNPFVGLFIVTIIKLEKYRFNYGRKWGKEKMEQSLIKLPVKNDQPDFDFMENYIKSLPYSSSI